VTWRLLALPPLPLQALAGFAHGSDVEVVAPAERTRAALLDALADAEIVVCDWSYQLLLDAEALRAAPKLAYVQHPSVGFDSTAVAVAAELGIPVANTPGANAGSVVEWCVLTALLLRRRFPQGDAEFRAGGWPQTSLRIREIAGSKVGILGLGAIGLLAAERFTALGAEVTYWSRTRKDVPYPYAELADVVATSDVLISLLPGGEATRHLIDGPLLATMQPSAYFLSAGRGSVVDEAALAECLQRKGIAGAALDVFEREPLAADSPLRSIPEAVITSHNAGASVEAGIAIIQMCQQNILRATTGEPINNVVNGTDPLVRRRL
jgi:D-3-phosphoglycerate dehydrogenase